MSANGIRISTLANGLRVVTDPMSTVETVSTGIWIDVGARQERASVNGVSHLLEHMVFKGTRRRDARAIAEEIEAVGGHLNAHTSREHTAFYAKVLKEDINLAVDIIADLVQNALLDPEELERERTVIIQEILQAMDTPDDLVFDRFQETAYPDQPLGRPVLGSAELIRDLPRADVVDYMRGHYAASRMVMAAAGRIEHDRFVELAGQALGTLPPGEPAPGEPARYVGGDCRDARDLEQVHVIFGFEGVAFRDPDFYAMSVMATLLGGGMSSRLFQEAREKRGLVYNIYTFPAAYTDGGLFGIYAGTGEREVEELVPLVCDEIVNMSADVTEREVARARAQLKSSILMSLESTSARCEQLARQMLVFGRPLPVPEVVAKVDAVDPAAVMGVARRLRSSSLTFTALGPVSRIEPFERMTQRLT